MITTGTKKLLETLNEIKELSSKQEKLLDEATKLIQKQKELENRDDANFMKLLKYRILLEHHMIWKSRRSYFKIINDFLTNQIDETSFCSQIETLLRKNNKEIYETEANLEFKTDFNFTSKSIGFAKVINILESIVNQFDPNLDDNDFDPIALESINYTFSKNELRSKIKAIILPEFLKYYNPN